MSNLTLIPNTFQCPNVIVDRIMFFLTDSEFRVYMYICREILGWDENRKTRRATIPVSAIMGSGSYGSGCGLSKNTVKKALSGLEDFNLIQRVGTATRQGQEWELILDADVIDFAGLEARKDSKKQSNKARVAKATSLNPKHNPDDDDGSSHEPPNDDVDENVTVRRTNPQDGSSHEPPSGSSHEPPPNHYINPSLKPTGKPNKSSSTNSTQIGTENEPVPESKDDDDDFFIGNIFKSFEDEKIGKLTEHNAEKLQDLIEDYGPVAVVHGIRACAEYEKRFFSYLETCAKNHFLDHNPVQGPEPKPRFYDADQATPTLPKPKPVPVLSEDADRWKAAYNQLELQIDKATFDTWIRPATFLHWQDGCFTIEVHNAMAKQMLEHRLYRNIRRVLSTVCGYEAELVFVVAGSDGKAA